MREVRVATLGGYAAMILRATLGGYAGRKDPCVQRMELAWAMRATLARWQYG